MLSLPHCSLSSPTTFPLNSATLSVELLQGEAAEGFLPGQISSSSGYGSLKGWPPGDLASS